MGALLLLLAAVGVLLSSMASMRGGRISTVGYRATALRAATKKLGLFGLFNYLSI